MRTTTVVDHVRATLVRAAIAGLLAAGLGSCGGASNSSRATATLSAALTGRALFSGSAGCAFCHTLAAAGATGQVGPNLDTHLRGDCAQLIAHHSHGSTLTQCIETMIVHPYAFVAPGYQPNIMPADFGSKLSTSQIAALAGFLAADAR